MREAGNAEIACALFCVTLSINPAPAQELSERDFLTEFPTVLSASRLRQNLSETPQAVTVIDQDMIRASGAREFAELFRMVPGFTVSYVTYAKGLQPIVNYHGLGREFFSRLQILIDGRSMNNATLGGVDWSEFPLALDDLDRIEVIRGPSNATHGIGAFLATINFITKHASQERGNDFSVRVGNNGIRDGTVRFGDGFGVVDYRLTVGHRADSGFANISDRRSRDYLTGRADWQIDAANNLMLQTGATSGVNGVNAGGPNDASRNIRINTAYAQLKWEHSLETGNGFYIQFYQYQFRLSDKFLISPQLLPGSERIELDGGTVVRRTDLELQQNFSAGANLRWVWGGSVREDVAEVPLLFTQNKQLQVQRLFAHVEWRLTDRALVNAGVMFEHNNLTKTDIAPQLAFNYRVASSHTFRLDVSRALRTPTLIENQGQFGVGAPGSPRFGPSGPDLRPETILSRELSYIGEWPALHATLDVKLFRDNLHDLIALIGVINSSPASVYPRNAINGDDGRQQGLEGQLVWNLSTETRLVATATHMETQSADHLDSYSTSAPRNTFHALASHRFAGTWEASVAIHQQGAFRASGFSESQRAFRRIDLRLSTRLPPAMGNGEVAIAVENLLDNNYTEYRLDDRAQRRAWLTFTFRM